MKSRRMGLNHLRDLPLRASQEVTAQTEEEGLAPLPLGLLTAGWEVPFEVYVKLRLKDNSDPEFVRCCERHHVLEHRWYKKLTDLGIGLVYYAPAEEGNVLQYLTHNLSNLLTDKNLSTEVKAGLLGDVTIVWIRHFFREEKARGGQLLEAALGYLDDLLELVRRGDATSGFVLDLWRYDQNLYRHSLNVCLAGLAFASYLGWSAADIKVFGLGCLVHDIGMIKVERSILRKDSELNEQEWVQIRRHPTSGFQMLKKYTTLSREVLSMVLQHHENGDGSGYPQGLKMANIHPWARLLRILDSYEAITAPRRWRSARRPGEALLLIKKDWEEKGIYDPALLRQFIKFLAGG